MAFVTLNLDNNRFQTAACH